MGTMSLHISSDFIEESNCIFSSFVCYMLVTWGLTSFTLNFCTGYFMPEAMYILCAQHAKLCGRACLFLPLFSYFSLSLIKDILVENVKACFIKFLRESSTERTLTHHINYLLINASLIILFYFISLYNFPLSMMLPIFI